MVLKSNAAKVAELVYRIAKFNGAEIADAYCFDGNEEYPDSFSMYFVVKYGLAVKKIRISNHTKQHKDAKEQNLLKSITVNEKTTFKDIEKFIINRINDVKRGSLYAAFDYIKNVLNKEIKQMSEFDRIAGYSDEKRELNDICKLFRRFDKLSDAGFRLPRGILLAGKPGVGKTVMAEAFIKESGVYCERISFDDTNKIAMTAYLDKKFKTAIEHLPAIVLMDELDKFVGDVSNGFNPTYDMNATRQILKVINDNVNDGLIVVATINDERMLSYALKRSGRFDRTLNIPLPDLNDRREIIAHYANGKKFDANVDFETLAKITAKLSGADIECIINDAGLNAILADRTEINQADIDDAVNRLMFQASKSSCPDENDSRLVAAHEAGHLVAGLILKKDEVGNASIIPQGDNSGHVKIGSQKSKIKTKSQYLDDIVISLAGKAAERIFFPDEEFNSTSGDYSSAYFYVRDMFFSGLFGFDLYVSQFRESSGKDISEERLRLIEKKRAEVLGDCLHTAEELLKSNIDLVNKYIEELTEKYTLTHDEIMAIYNQMRPEAA